LSPLTSPSTPSKFVVLIRTMFPPPNRFDCGPTFKPPNFFFFFFFPSPPLFIERGGHGFYSAEDTLPIPLCPTLSPPSTSSLKPFRIIPLHHIPYIYGRLFSFLRQGPPPQKPPAGLRPVPHESPSIFAHAPFSHFNTFSFQLLLKVLMRKVRSYTFRTFPSPPTLPSWGPPPSLVSS